MTKFGRYKMFLISTLPGQLIKPYSTQLNAGGGICVKKQGPITCFGINRPATKNCLTPELAKSLLYQIKQFEMDNSSFAGVIYGERGNFCNGIHPIDLKGNPNIYEDILKTGLFDTFCSKPIVAALSGYSAGLGFDLALWCDFRVAEETAVLALYSQNYGVPCNKKLASRLQANVGWHKAMDILLTGRAVTTKEGMESGAITRTVACGAGLGQAVNFAYGLSNMPQYSLKANRALLYTMSNTSGIDEIILHEYEHNLKSSLKEINEGLHITRLSDNQNKE